MTHPHLLVPSHGRPADHPSRGFFWNSFWIVPCPPPQSSQKSRGGSVADLPFDADVDTQSSRALPPATACNNCVNSDMVKRSSGAPSSHSVGLSRIWEASPRQEFVKTHIRAAMWHAATQCIRGFGGPQILSGQNRRPPTPLTGLTKLGPSGSRVRCSSSVRRISD